MAKLRSFIAVQLSSEVRQVLSRIQGILKTGSRASVKWVEPNNLHLTLKFLGDIDTGRIEAILSHMKESAAGTGTLHLEMTGLGTFPEGRRVRIIWAGLAGDINKLSAAQERIETGLEPLGFQKEARRFQPHLTIGRVRDQASPSEREDLYRAIEQYTAFNKIPFTVSSVYLMKSTLTPSGPVYAELGQARL